MVCFPEIAAESQHLVFPWRSDRMDARKNDMQMGEKHSFGGGGSKQNSRGVLNK